MTQTMKLVDTYIKSANITVQVFKENHNIIRRKTDDVRSKMELLDMKKCNI